MRRILIVLAAAILLSTATLSLDSRTSDVNLSGPGGDMVLYRYDTNRSGRAPFTGNVVEPQVRWMFNSSGDFISPPLIADLNDDGRFEIAVQSDVGELSIIDENGSPLYGTSFGPEFPMMPAAADIDGDGKLEIIAGQGTHSYGGSLDIYALNGEDLSLIWNHTSTSISEHGFFASPMFHDSSGDGLLDVLVGSMDDYFYAFNGLDGSIIWNSSKGLHYIRTTSPMDDIDNDGHQEIVGFDNAALIRLYDAGTGTVEWEDILGYGVGSSPLIADFDGDGFGEIACFMVISGGVSVLNHDGSVLWNDTSVNGFYTSPTVSDVDSDGLPDLIGGNYWNHSVQAYRGYDGSPLWMTVLPNNAHAQSPLVTTDIDGDGEEEVLALGKERNLFSIDAKTGDIEWIFNIDRPFGQPTVWDIDQDGIAEIVLSAGGGKVYVIEQTPSPEFSPRTIGYWKHQCNVDRPGENHPGIKGEFVLAIAENSSVLSGVQSEEDVCSILWSHPKSNMTGRALTQLMALWLNIVSGLVDVNAEINLGVLTSAGTVGDAIAEVEDILLNIGDRSELERAKDIADALNNGIGG
ncbi:MAG: FG-GAP-like repeat-containing protein [Thermoplasmata archaeon]